jgi:tetratricopeptide (TPR) repeat protein
MPAEVREVKTANTKIPLPFLKEKLAEVSFAKVDLETRVTEMKRSFKEKQEQINKLKIRSRKKEAIESELQKLEEAFKKETLKFHYNLALIYDRNKDYNKAVNEYLEALKISPNDADSHYNLAVVYDDHLQDKKKAIEHYKKYLDIRPDSPDAKKVEYWITRAEGDLKSEGKVFFPRK